MTHQTHRQFSTLAVATAATGICFEDINMSEIKEVLSHLCGYDVFTHELAHQPTLQLAYEEARRQFPSMPSREETSADWKQARDRIIDAYGAILNVKRGTASRQENPVETLAAVTGSLREGGV